MIISHRHKFAYFRVPKTGSSTAELLLRLSGAFDQNDIMSGALSGLPAINIPQTVKDKMEASARRVLLKLTQQPNKAFNEAAFEQQVQATLGTFIAHMTPADAVKTGLLTIEQLREYTVVAFVRDPYERHLSAFRMMMQGIAVVPDMYKDSLLNNPRTTDKEGVLVRPQADYFFVDGEQVTEPLFFGDYDNEVRRMIAMVGGYVFNEMPQLNPSRPLVGNKAEFYADSEVSTLLDTMLDEDVKLLKQFETDYSREETTKYLRERGER